jgi:predicted transposase YbfD/YdcC
VPSTDKSSVARAHSISSDPDPVAQNAAIRIRRHWSVESGLHWVLDTAFREDEARHRAKITAEHLATLTHFALSLIQQVPDRKGVAAPRKRDSWDHDDLLQILTSEAR